jgi:chromate reductase
LPSRHRCGALVFPDMFALPHADQAFDSDGQLRDPALEERLRREVVGFVWLADAIAPICGRGARTGPAPTRQQEVAKALEVESDIQPSAQ